MRTDPQRPELIRTKYLRLTWEATLDGGKVIKAQSLAQMERPYKMADGKDDFFGLGFVAYPIDRRALRA
jgi:hypothetical protein